MRCVPAVLDGVVSASWQHLGDLGPLISQLFLHLHNNAVFFGGPLTLFDVWLQVIVVALATLLATARL